MPAGPFSVRCETGGGVSGGLRKDVSRHASHAMEGQGVAQAGRGKHEIWKSRSPRGAGGAAAAGARARVFDFGCAARGISGAIKRVHTETRGDTRGRTWGWETDPRGSVARGMKDRPTNGLPRKRGSAWFRRPAKQKQTKQGTGGHVSG